MKIILVILFVLVVSFLIYAVRKKNKPHYRLAPVKLKKILQDHVQFYQLLSKKEKQEFRSRVQHFLSKVRITGIETSVEDMDRVFVAAAAIIPIFAFKNWKYRTINEVLIYPGSFSKEYHRAGAGRDVSGMVGDGAMHHLMIISQQGLRYGFLSHDNPYNTAIHEFVHLIDKEDGFTDGFPESLLPYRSSLPWLKRIHQEIKLIQEGRSDINPYGAISEAEFLAVAAEYFFKQPERMEKHHPELYATLRQIFINGDHTIS